MKHRKTAPPLRSAPREPLGPAGPKGELNDRERAVHLLSRLAFGHSARDLALVLEIGQETWLDQQLEARGFSSERLQTELDGLSTLKLTPRECLEEVEIELDRDPSREERAKRSRSRKRVEIELVQATVLRATFSDRQAEEVLCDFWRNHFNVSFTKDWPIHIFMPDYDRSVLRANVLGSFPAMLEASAKHPAMLFYLDNHLSKKPPTKQELAEIARRVERETGSAQRGEEAARIASLRGINENYARELLELHTLGVDRSYRQDDVITVAEALTGWGIDMTPDGTREFRFARNLHVEEGGRFLGYVLRRDKKDGMALGERVLDILGKHDHTAEFVCTKLTRYLVNDEPPRKVVERAVKAYKKSDGEIPAVVRAIVSSDDFWSRENYRAKFKTPYEFVISALRATGAEVDARNDLRHMLTLLGQPLYNCDDPTGYYDTAEAWLDPGVMALRWRFAIDLAAGKVRGVHIPEEFYADLPLDGGAVASMQAMVDKVLPGGAGPRTLSMLLEVTREHESGEGLDLESWGPELLGLLLGSPEFQQQ